MKILQLLKPGAVIRPSEHREDIAMMKKTALVVGTVATLALAAAQPAEARRGWGPGLIGGLAVGALLAGAAASSAYAYGPYDYYGPGYGYYGPRYYRPAYYGYYGPRYYRPAYYGPRYYGPRYYAARYYRPAYYGYYGPAYRRAYGYYGGPAISVGFGGGWGW
jgi:hypothetical protein